MRRALDDYVLTGVTTNLELLRHVLRHQAYMDGDTTTAFLSEYPYEPEGFPDDVCLIARALAAGAGGNATLGASGGADGGDTHSPWDALGGKRL